MGGLRRLKIIRALPLQEFRRRAGEGESSAMPLRATAMRRMTRRANHLARHCIDLPALSSPIRKNILVFRNENQHYIHNRPVPKEGRCATSRNVGRDAVDADGALDEGV